MHVDSSAGDLQLNGVWCSKRSGNRPPDWNQAERSSAPRVTSALSIFPPIQIRPQSLANTPPLPFRVRLPPLLFPMNLPPPRVPHPILPPIPPLLPAIQDPSVLPRPIPTLPPPPLLPRPHRPVEPPGRRHVQRGEGRGRRRPREEFPARRDALGRGGELEEVMLVSKAERVWEDMRRGGS